MDSTAQLITSRSRQLTAAAAESDLGAQIDEHALPMTNCCLQSDIASAYKKQSQKARVLTEAWVRDQVRCPGCGGSLRLLPPNTKVADFECNQCGEMYQLKSQSRPFERKILGAEYKSTIKSIQSGRHPSLILLEYDRISMMVRNLEFIHKSWISPSVVVPRKPLGPNARRANWQGCQLDLDQIPDAARVQAIREGVGQPEEQVRTQWHACQLVAEATAESRGWLSDILRVIDSLPAEFTLQDVYRFEFELARLYPSNQHIRETIRKQLQKARDRGIVEFVQRGRYRKTNRANPGAT